jgi:SAM-dependent methyltransferase
VDNSDSTYSAYDSFAWVYNKHWAGYSAKVLPTLEKHVLVDLPQQAKILDLCCGCGHLAALLKKRGFAVVGIDGSEEMLRFARENAPDCEFVRADARSFHLIDRFDAVLSMFDSLNHILTLEELTKVFRNVRTSLKHNGCFVFDMNMENGYKQRWNGSWNIVEQEYVCAVRSQYSPETRLAEFFATIFRQMDGKWIRSDVSLPQKCYRLSEVLEALRTAGFKEVRAYEYGHKEGLQEIVGEGDRAMFICRKD